MFKVLKERTNDFKSYLVSTEINRIPIVEMADQMPPSQLAGLVKLELPKKKKKKQDVTNQELNAGLVVPLPASV